MNTKCPNMTKNIEFSKKSKFILLLLLVILNFILRIPSIPHEKGGDSFSIHGYANSITNLGIANWWINWLSVFGLYPESYASAIPYSLSGLSQLTGLDGIKMEYTILLFSVTMGLFSIFTVYLLAGIIYNKFVFKYIAALFYSIGQGVMVFSTWEISTRGPFMVFLPLYIFILLSKKSYSKKISLLTPLFVFLAAIHHFFYFLIPLTVIYLALKITPKVIPNRNKNYYFNYVYGISLMIVVSFPFISHSMITAGSRYDWILEVIKINARFVGPIVVIAFGGLVNILLKESRKFEEWYLLLAFLCLTPLFYNQVYGVYITYIFLIFFLSMAFCNIVNVEHKKIIPITIVFLILLSSTFSAYYNHERTGSSEGYWYMTENTYSTAKWGNSYVSEKNVLGQGLLYHRVTATSDGHLSTPMNNLSELEVIKVSPTSSRYYFDGPYVSKPLTSVSGLISWLLDLPDIDDPRAQKIIKDLELYYYLDTDYSSTLRNSIAEKRNCLYNSGSFKIWEL